MRDTASVQTSISCVMALGCTEPETAGHGFSGLLCVPVKPAKSDVGRQNQPTNLILNP